MQLSGNSHPCRAPADMGGGDGEGKEGMIEEGLRMGRKDRDGEDRDGRGWEGKDRGWGGEGSRMGRGRIEEGRGRIEDGEGGEGLRMGREGKD